MILTESLPEAETAPTEPEAVETAEPVAAANFSSPPVSSIGIKAICDPVRMREVVRAVRVAPASIVNAISHDAEVVPSILQDSDAEASTPKVVVANSKLRFEGPIVMVSCSRGLVRCTPLSTSWIVGYLQQLGGCRKLQSRCTRFRRLFHWDRQRRRSQRMIGRGQHVHR